MMTALGNKKFLMLVVIFFILAMGFNFVALLNYYISMFFLYGGDKAAAGTLLGIQWNGMGDHRTGRSISA